MNINHSNNQYYENKNNEIENEKQDEIINQNLQNNLFEEAPVLRTSGNKQKKIFSNEENVNNNKLEEKQIEIIQKEKKDEKKEEEEEKERKQAIKDGDKIRSRIMDRINKARARSTDSKPQKDTKSQNILMKAKLLEKVLGNMKTPEDLHNKNIDTNHDIEKESIRNNIYDNNSLREHSEDIVVVKKKKKKKNMIPFDG